MHTSHTTQPDKNKADIRDNPERKDVWTGKPDDYQVAGRTDKVDKADKVDNPDAPRPDPSFKKNPPAKAKS